jgi:hypothetical protein
MPKEKSLTKVIPNIYKRNAENIGLFFFVKAQKQIIPTVTLDQAIMNFFRFAEISLDEWDLESARTTYNRMQKDFYDDCRS